jgi:hypothetical protein
MKASGESLRMYSPLSQLQLHQVEDRTAQRDAREVVLGDHLGEREDVAFFGVEVLGDDLLLGGLGHATAH